MNVNLANQINHTFAILRDKVQVSDRQKNTILVAFSALSFLAFCYFALRCCITGKIVEQKEKEEILKPAKEILVKKEQDKKIPLEKKESPQKIATKGIQGKQDALELRSDDHIQKSEEGQEEELVEVQSVLKQDEVVLKDSQVLDDKTLLDDSVVLDDKALLDNSEVLADREKEIIRSVPLLAIPDSKAIPPVKTPSVILTYPFLSFGQVRQSTVPGDPPSFMGTQYFGRDTVIDTERLITAAFACCFHTMESHQEIYALLSKIRIKMDPFPGFYEKKHYAESMTNLYNNLVRLHDSLPGKSKEKKIKIYWSEAVEEELIPYLFMNEKANLEKLLFAVIPGETAVSPFQGSTMDFENQLQFIKLAKKPLKLISQHIDEIEALAEEVLGQTISESLDDLRKEIRGAIFYKKLMTSPLVAQASGFSFMIHAYRNLHAMKMRGEKIDFAALPKEGQRKFLKVLLSPPAKT